MDESLRSRAVAAMKSLGKRGRTSRVPAAVRESVLAYVEAARRSGRPWRQIGGELGLSTTAVQRWRRNTAGRTRRSALTMLPVVVRESRSEVGGADRVTIVTPGGLRVEGLAIAQAAELIARLS